MQVIKCLLIVPFPESALNEHAGKMFMEDYEEYFRHSKMLTELYAMPKELKAQENNIKKQKTAVEEKIEQSPVKKENGQTGVANNKKKWMKRI